MISDPAQLLARETAKLAATELVYELLGRAGVNREDLAQLAGISEPRLTDALEGGDSLTVGLLAGLAHTLGYRLVIQAEVAS